MLWTCKLTSSHSRTDVLSRINAITQHRPSLLEWVVKFGVPIPKHVEFYGNVTGTRFRIRRAILGQNSFMPCIIGSVHQSDEATNLTLLMHIPLFVLPVLAIPFVTLASLICQSRFGPLMPMLLICCMVLWICIHEFSKQCNWAKDRLATIIDATQIR